MGVQTRFLIVCLMLCQVCLAPATHAAPAVWKLAVVFAHHASSRTYIGTIQSPRLNSIVSKDITQLDSKRLLITVAYDYEVWLAGDGVTAALWYSSVRKVYGSLSSDGKQGEPRRDDDSLSRLVRIARPAVSRQPVRPRASTIEDYTTPPDSVAGLCRASSAILVGRVVGILRVAHTPENYQGAEQHTVFVVDVETSLKTEGGDTTEASVPAIVKVWQEGGDLPWKDETGSGLGYSISNTPPLCVGTRYLLFLHSPDADDEHSVYRRKGYVPASIGSVYGKAMELDEYTLTHPACSTYLIQNGLTRSNGEESPFPQLLNIPEAKARKIVRTDIVASPAKPVPGQRLKMTFQAIHDKIDVAAQQKNIAGATAYLSSNFHAQVKWVESEHGNIMGSRARGGCSKSDYIQGMQSFFSVADGLKATTVVIAVAPAAEYADVLRDDLFGVDLRKYRRLTVVVTGNVDSYNVWGMHTKTGAIGRSETKQRKDLEVWTQTPSGWQEIYFCTLGEHDNSIPLFAKDQYDPGASAPG